MKKTIFFLFAIIMLFVGSNSCVASVNLQNSNCKTKNIAIFERLDSIFDLESLSQGLPFYIISGGHEAFPFIMLIDNNDNYIVYSGSMTKKGNYISKDTVGRDNELLRWAFKELPAVCTNYVNTSDSDYHPIIISMIGMNRNKQIIFVYDNDMKFTCSKCQNNVSELLSFLYMKYIYKL